MAPDALERVSDRVYRVKDRYVNLYVIDAGRIVLADTGTRTAEPKIRAGLRELGKEVSDVGLVLLTHHHGDHMGTAGVWAREARAQVAVHEADREVVAGRERRSATGGGAASKVVVTFLGVFARLRPAEPVEPGRTLAGDETLDLLGLRLRTVHAPGHTLGSCAFHLLPDDVLFAGDAVNARDGRPGPPRFVEDPDAAVRSYERLLAIPRKALCPGHGEPIRGP